jgi:GDP-mannose pyrophosphatase NudK
MSPIIPTITKEQILFNNIIVIEEGLLQTTTAKGVKRSFSRIKVNRQDAAAVLIYNTDTRKVILTRQFRYAVASLTKEPILEIMAGKVDEGEEPLETGIREAMEECGYRIERSNIHHLASFYASPGYTTEKYHLYFATVTTAGHINAGGGLEEENESIEVVEMDLPVFMKMAEDGLLEDGKTLMAAMLVKNRAGLIA